jgi:DNA-directed RNA polymerase subunit RPC12/RpoP
MPITVPCLKCKTKFQVPSKLAGQTVACKSCGYQMRLPSPEKIQAKKQGAAAGKKSSTPARTPARAPTKPAAMDLDVVDYIDDTADTVTSGAVGTSGNKAAAPATEPPVLSCSHCEGLLYYDPNFANQTVACPHCGNHLIMPTL